MIDSVYFVNNSLGNLVKKLEKNDIYHLSQEVNANILNLLKRKDFFPLATGMTLKTSMKAYLAKINFIMH